MRISWYRFRATAGRRWPGYVSIALLTALLGGLAMGAAAAARRTQSAYPSYLAHTNPSDVGTYSAAATPADLSRLAHLPQVARAESALLPNVLTLGPTGAPLSSADPFASAVFPIASLDGLYFNEDRPTVAEGRMADPNRADEFVMSTVAAEVTGARVGQVVKLGFYTNDQANSPSYGTAPIPPQVQIEARLVGLVVFNNEVVRDDVDRFPTLTVFTPALARRIASCCFSGVVTGLQLSHGRNDLASVETELSRTPPGFNVRSVTAVIEAKAEQAIKPDTIALGLAGAIAALAALLIGAQVIGRQLLRESDDVAVLRALGAGRATTAADGVIGVGGGIVIGALLATGVAVALSPIAPIGPVRSVVPSPGVVFDWTVLGLGTLLLVIAMSAVVAVVVSRRAPHRPARRTDQASLLAGAAAASGLSAPAVTGIRFAVESGRGRGAVPARSAILGAVVAVGVISATLTFGASLSNLVSHPRLYGWNWDFEIVSGYGGLSNIPLARISPLLRGDRDVASWSGIYLTPLELDGQSVPGLAMSPNAAVAPPLLSGHSLAGTDETVLGATTLARLHKRVGDTVSSRALLPVVANGSSAGVTITGPRLLKIVGTATLPSIGVFGNFHLEMGTGAILPDSLLPTAALGGGARDGPEGIFVRLRPGADRGKAFQQLRQIAAASSSPDDGPASVVAVQRPAEIVNYRSMTAPPAFLSAAVAAGAVTALALTLIATVRRRRRDLALLNAIGFTPRQLRAVVAWQSTVAVLIGTVIGAPLGVVGGRALWDLFADALHVVPEPVVPVPAVILVVVGAVVLANVVAAIPARTAARTPTSQLLRAE